MKELLITGGAGFIGSRLAKYYQKNKPTVLTRPQLDISDKAAVLDFVERTQPKVILHTAALSSTGYCQQHPEESFWVNVKGTENLALAAQKVGAKLVFFSSDQVYMGSRLSGPHLEEEPITPSGIYGQHKRQAELCALAACPDTVCLRASWMYDLPVEGTKNSLGLLGAIAGAALAGEHFAMNPGEKRGITWAGLLVRQMDAIAKLPGGIYNAGAENPCNSFETGRAFARLMKTSEEVVTKADYPARDLSMNCQKLRAQGIELGDTIRGFEACLKAYNIL